MPFCVKCGHKLPDGTAFCPNCGAPATPSEITSEEVLGVMMAVEKRLPAFGCNLVFTTSRLIAAKRRRWGYVAGTLGGAAVGFLGLAELVVGGAGILGAFFALLICVYVGSWLGVRFDRGRVQRLKQLSIESILRSDKKNYEIPYAAIIRVNMKKLSRFWSWPYHTDINVDTQRKTHKFRLSSGNYEGAAHLIRSVLRDKVYVA